MRELIIGIDGGGTKTNLIAMDIQTGLIAASTSTGSIHIFTMGETTALRNLELGIAGLQLGNEDHVVAVAIGDPAIDDCDDDNPDTPLAAAAADLCGSCKVFIKSDVFVAMYAFFGGEPGAFLVSGTGSMGIALTEAYHHSGTNAYFTVGGWAMPTTDPGSGFDIAIQGIQAAVHAFDGVADYTELCDALLEFGQMDSPRQLIPWFNNGSLTRGQIAQFAQYVDNVPNAEMRLPLPFWSPLDTVLLNTRCACCAVCPNPGSASMAVCYCTIRRYTVPLKGMCCQPFRTHRSYIPPEHRSMALLCLRLMPFKLTGDYGHGNNQTVSHQYPYLAGYPNGNPIRRH